MQTLRQCLGTHASRTVQRRHQPVIDVTAQQSHDTRDILVLEHGKHRNRLAIARHLHQIQRQRLSGVRIVGDIQNHGGSPRKNLKPSGIFNGDQPRTDIAGTDGNPFAYGIQRRDTSTGIGELKSTA